MDTLDAIEQRRSVKQYDSSVEMPEEDIQRLLDLALLSPTSFNIQNWRFVVVRNPEQRKRLRAAAWDQAQVEDAQLLLVLCGDLKSWDKDPARYWRNAPEAAQQQIVPMIGEFYTNQGEQTQRDEAMRSCGIAAQTLMLAAKSMGYDSCPMIGFDPQQVAELINLPDDHAIGLLLAIGKAAAPARPRGGQLDKDEVVVTDRFA
ncbi:putative NAD(P)H nitroreductase MhqN [Posidoniimonas polymericola]|uniref:Putative NAD(P)H nitroreductase MhqN n=1 Tax=Posidoniimonas polymericola TaxID=2528002 RepID=A0A5C5XSV6_9BACT|nr:nitroreductase family protein [Posidoniimonas polymericola]TWT65413.1 putative NAD(P)H nitroreductase MhqN [Posidoniimonas polymericola]